MATFAQDKRVYPRLRPRGLVSLAIYQGERIPPAFAILSDISESGACMVSDRILARGQSLQLRIQFIAEPDLFETGADVRWMHPVAASAAGALTGVQFAPISSSTPQLKQVLARAGFAVREPELDPFEEMLTELRPYLDALWTRLAAATGT